MKISPFVAAACLLFLQVSTQGAAADAVEKVISLGKVKVSVVTADGSVASSFSGSQPKQLLEKEQLSAPQSLEISFSPKLADGAAFKPQQVMVMLTHTSSGLSAYAVGKAKKDGSYTLATTNALIEKQIGKQAGVYEVTLLVGDPSAAGVQYALGTLDIAVTGSTAAPVRTARIQPVNNIKPEIVHTHRPAQKRPPAIVSLVFTGLVGVPLAGVLVALLAYGINFKGFPSGTAALAALVFHATLAAFLALYVLFWLQMNLLQTLPIALALGVVLFVSGHYALRGVAAARLKKD